jgi:hypothetical protein
VPKKYKNIFPMEVFLGQVNKIMAERGLKSGAAFDREAGLVNKAARWFNPEWRGRSVDTDTLLTIAKSFAKSLDWLVFGQPPALSLAETAPEIYEARPLVPVEMTLLNEVIGKIEEVMVAEKKDLGPEAKARLITRIYNDCSEDRIRPDFVMAKRYLWLLS